MKSKILRLRLFSLAMPFIACLLPAFSGCSHAPQHLLGAKYSVEVATPIVELKKSQPNVRIQVKGEMVEKCPVAGCWFVLRDKTGTVRVDTKSAGFVVTDIPLHTILNVNGRLTKDAEPQISATGLRY